jgi:hypothetical protein
VHKRLLDGGTVLAVVGTPPGDVVPKAPVQLQSTNAETPGKTEEYQRARRINRIENPAKSAKPPSPGSNPGGVKSQVLPRAAS